MNNLWCWISRAFEDGRSMVIVAFDEPIQAFASKPPPYNA